MREENLYDGKYEPKPFVLSSDEKTVSIIVAIVFGCACAILLGNSIFSNAQENDIEGVLNLIIGVGVGFLAYHAAVFVAKLRYKNRIAREEQLFEERKRAAIPYTVCEFCGGKIEKDYTKIEDKITGGWSLREGTLMQHTNKFEIGMEHYSCEKCQYIVRCDTQRANYSGVVGGCYTLVKPSVLENSPIEKEQLENGRLVAYLKKHCI